MGEFSKHYKGQDLIALNVFHMYKQVVHTSCIVLCNGRTIDRECLTMTPGHSYHHKFPFQCPTTSNWTLQENALKKISSQYYTFSHQLGDFVSSPHCPKKWTTTHDGHILHHSQIINDQDVHLIYVKPTRYSSRPQTRSGIIFQTSHSVLGTSDLPYHASVIQTGNNSIQLHSWTKIYAPPSNVPSFWDNIGAYGNESLWKNLRCDGDVSWIYDGMCTGSLVIIHDRSFIKEISPYIQIGRAHV